MNEILGKQETEISHENIEYYFENYHELYAKFNLFSKEINYSDYVFRGHSKEEYLLKPTIKRNEDEIREGSFTKEIDLLERFATSLSRSGLHIPRGGECFLRLNPFISNLQEWPSSEVLDFLAYAQHNGLSTRMLDWTYDINIALYMAADGVVKNVEKMILRKYKDEEIIEENFQDKNIVIWCFNYAQWDRLTGNICQDLRCHGPQDSILRFTQINYEDNRFAYRQKGLLSYNKLHAKATGEFIKDRYAVWNTISSEEDNLDIEAYIKTYMNDKVKSTEKITDPQMIKIKIPAKQSLNILDILSQLDYKEESIFPTPQNIAKLIMKNGKNLKLKELFAQV